MNRGNKVDIEATIKKEELKNLGEKVDNLRKDGGADEELKQRNKPVDFSGSDLDIPGRTLPSDRNPRNIKDEENQLYGQGGGGNGHLETNSK